MANQTIGETREAMAKDMLEYHVPNIAKKYKSRFKYIWLIVNVEQDLDDPTIFKQAIGITNVKPQPKSGMYCLRVATDTCDTVIEWVLPKNKSNIILPEDCYDNKIVGSVYDTVRNLPNLIG